MIEYIKQQILNSKSLAKKIKHLEELELSYKGKDYSDFLFTIEDSICVRLETDSESQSKSFGPLNKFIGWISDILDKIKSEYLEDYSPYKHFKWASIWKIEIGYILDVKFDFKTEEFKLRNGRHSFVRLYQDDNRLKYNIRASNSDSENIDVFKVESEEIAKKLILALDSIKYRILEVESQLKKELLPIFAEIEKISDSEKREKIKEWLSKNVDENTLCFL